MIKMRSFKKNQGSKLSTKIEYIACVVFNLFKRKVSRQLYIK